VNGSGEGGYDYFYIWECGMGSGVGVGEVNESCGSMKGEFGTTSD
jgi:hypothetical protein